LYPQLIVDLAKIKANAAGLVNLVGPSLAVAGVTKGCAGSVPVAQAMIEGGVSGLADSRLPHLIKLRANFPDFPLLLLRQPMRGEIDAAAAIGATIMISDPQTARLLAEAAKTLNVRQRIMLVLEVGDLREGVPPADLLEFAADIDAHPSIELAGIAANAGCTGGRAPTRESMALLDRTVRRAAEQGLPLKTVSVGNSSCWKLLSAGKLSSTGNHVRFGEAILLGREALSAQPIDGLNQDAFEVRAEVLESSVKSGGRQLLVAVGCQDIGRGRLFPLDERLTVTRVTSDHCVVRANTASEVAGSGEAISFRPSYFALQSMASSACIRKVYLGYNSSRELVSRART
jgi:ornithine racemase